MASGRSQTKKNNFMFNNPTAVRSSSGTRCARGGTDSSSATHQHVKTRCTLAASPIHPSAITSHHITFASAARQRASASPLARSAVLISSLASWRARACSASEVLAFENCTLTQHHATKTTKNNLNQERQGCLGSIRGGVPCASCDDRTSDDFFQKRLHTQQQQDHITLSTRVHDSQ